MTVYDLESVDPDALNTSHAQVVALVGRDKVVLDIGCSTGYLGKALAQQGCTVDGVEIDPEAAEMARRHLRSVVLTDLNRDDLVAAIGDERYDTIVMADVLEHLVDPRTVLSAAVNLLADGGEIVISVPNVSHGSLRLALLQGRWEYRPTGLLDRTHLRFFTRESILELVREAGLGVVELRSTVNDPLATEVEIDETRLPFGLVDWVRTQPGSFDYQYVLRARPGAGENALEVLPAAVIPEMDEARRREVELRDLDTSQLERIELWRKVLTLRDHVVGTEAELGHSRVELDQMRAERDEAQRVYNEMRVSASWRLGQIIVAPLSGIRRRWRGR